MFEWIQEEHEQMKTNIGKSCIVNKKVLSEDYKTVIAHDIRYLRKDEEVVILDAILNLYGTFYYVEAQDGETFFIKAENIAIKETK